MVVLGGCVFVRCGEAQALIGVTSGDRFVRADFSLAADGSL